MLVTLNLWIRPRIPRKASEGGLRRLSGLVSPILNPMGRSVMERRKAKPMPTALKMPKSLRASMRQAARDKKPIMVVNVVREQGNIISPMVRLTASDLVLHVVLGSPGTGSGCGRSRQCR